VLLKLAAARMEAGYKTKKDLVEDLNKRGLNISKNTYNRIESGKQIADVETAFFIAEYLERDIKEIFLLESTQKMNRNSFKAS
jgi:DNA-binding XRE family transcriptional regulator